MGRPKKEIDQKQFEKFCGLQCTLEEICAFSMSQTKRLIGGAKKRTASFSPKFSRKRGGSAKFRFAETSGGWLKRAQLWLLARKTVSGAERPS